jgi:hypothetical protein
MGTIMSVVTALALSPACARAAVGVEGITAVSSKVSPDYVRTRLADGSFQPEEFGFVDGGRLDGTFRDPSIDKLAFLDVAKTLAGPLAAQGYVPAKGLDSERLLIVVFWGTTIVSDPFNMSTGVISGNGSIVYLDSVQRDVLDAKNAKILGYDSEKLIQSDFGNFFTYTGMPGQLRDELVSEIEESRYFVVLLAYDFQAFRKGIKHKLWETRFSINEPSNHFDKALLAMAQYASVYFGQDSRGLLRKPIPEGSVKVGEPKALGEVEAPAK